MEAKEYLRNNTPDKNNEATYEGNLEVCLNEFALIKCKEMASNMKAVDKFGFVSHAEEFIPKDLLT